MVSQATSRRDVNMQPRQEAGLGSLREETQVIRLAAECDCLLMREYVGAAWTNWLHETAQEVWGQAFTNSDVCNVTKLHQTPIKDEYRCTNEFLLCLNPESKSGGSESQFFLDNESCCRNAATLTLSQHAMMELSHQLIFNPLQPGGPGRAVHVTLCVRQGTKCAEWWC